MLNEFQTHQTPKVQNRYSYNNCKLLLFLLSLLFYLSNFLICLNIFLILKSKNREEEKKLILDLAKSLKTGTGELKTLALIH